MAGRSFRVVIVGGGAAGAFVAANLLRTGDGGLEVVVVEPRAELGLGVAYSTRDPWHRLNVPAGSMSAIADDADHFRRWADLPAEAFARRVDYGRYMQAVVAEAVASSAATLRHVQDEAARVEPHAGGLRVTLSDGEALEADAVVLATGVETPVQPPYLAALGDDDRVIGDPWVPGALERIEDGETVAIIGTSLTAVDLAGSILTQHPGTRVLALSRNGDLPRPHEDPWRPRLPEPAFTIAEFLAFDDPLAEAAARLQASGADWPRAVDSLRPISQALWMAMGDDLRQRFLDKYRHDWEIHRHRMAAEIARDLDGWIAHGRLDVRAAAISAVEPSGEQLRIRARGAAGAGEGPATIEVDRIIVAIGPNMDPMANPLLGAAILDGIARPGPLDIGIDVDPATGLVIDAHGETPRQLYAIGALRKGVLWETLAVPEIRGQAHDVASRILGSPGG